MTRLIIAGGTLFGSSHDPEPGTVIIDRQTGCIEAIVSPSETPSAAGDDTAIDATGCWVAPGCIDLMASIPDPGREHRETLATGAAAAARGGYTTLYTTPDTDPVVDTQAVAADIVTRARSLGGTAIVPHAAATVHMKGEDLAPYGDLYDSGCRAVYCGTFPIADAGLARNVLSYADAFDMVVMVTGLDPSIGDGLCDEGIWSTRLGLPASPSLAERMAIDRDCSLAELTGARIHFARVSTAAGLEAVERAKARGVRVTCSCTPHHLHLDASALVDYDPHYRVWPPLRSPADIAALRAGVASGLVDAIISDHRPLHAEDKRREFMSASAGISGVETTLGLVLDLVHSGDISPQRALDALSGAPARIMQITDRGALSAGMRADIVVIDPNSGWLIEPDQFASKGKNTPFAGRVMTGRASTTIVGGNTVWQLNGGMEP